MAEPKRTTYLRSFLAPSRPILILALALLFGLGLAIRLYDLTDLPLDFHPTRQLFSALKARGMYYQGLTDTPDWQRQMAIQQWKIKATVEPPVLERIVAATYRLTGEQLWIARLYSSLFWVMGGVFLFLLARDLVSTDGALIAAAFYLFLPYAVSASRSFQPDPLMVALVLLFCWAVWNWGKCPAWGWAILAGVSGGLAIYIKTVAAFFIVGGALGVMLGRYRFKDLLRNPQVWGMIILGALPGTLYLIDGIFISGYLANQLGGRFFPQLLISPVFYARWEGKIALIMGHMGIVLGLLGAFFFNSRPGRAFVISLWAAYLAYGFIFDYHIASHDYYSLPLIPIVALSLAALADLLFVRLDEVTADAPLFRLAATTILLLGWLTVFWDVRTEMKATDYRPEAARWAQIGDLLGHQSMVMALTEDYGSRLAYWGWQNATIWPTHGDILYHTVIRGGEDDLEHRFDALTGGKEFFLITMMNELDYQPELKGWLYGAYPIYAEDEGYVIFDLRNPRTP